MTLEHSVPHPALPRAAALGSTLVWDAFAGHPWIARGEEALGFAPA